jgi:putative transposase
MARLPRLYAPDLPSHLILRGNNRSEIFRGDGDRMVFRAYLLDACAANDLYVHSYVFMPNHVHLLATGRRVDSAARAIQSVGRRYVGYFNARYARTGTLWEGRYRSTVVEVDGYLLACHRYIDLNPVRAGLASGPAEFPWSSHRCHAQGVADDLVTPHALVLALGDGPEARRKAYVALFEKALEGRTLDLIRSCSHKGWALGSDSFCRLLESRTQRRTAPIMGGWPKGRSRTNPPPA